MNSTIQWKPLNSKHSNYIKKGIDSKCTYNVAEGAVRAGKTIDNILIFALNLGESDDYLHLVSASSSGIAKTIIGDSNGFGLEHLFKGRCRWGKYKGIDIAGKGKGVETLFIQTPKGNKALLFIGGGKADSFKSIRGLTIGMWLATEINLHKQNFIQEAINRTLSSKHRKIIWDTNCETPKHFIYTKYIDKWRNKKDFVSGINYGHFTIFDNASITSQRRKEILSEYDEGSVWYKRDILGLRVVAEGKIYYNFYDHHIIDDDEMSQKHFREFSIGIDIGESKSAFTMNSIGILLNNEGIGLLDEYYHRNDDHVKINKKGDIEYAEDVANFLLKHKNKYKMLPRRILIDQNRPMFIIAVEKALRKVGINPSIVRYAHKKIINVRIRAFRQLFTLDKIFINKKCKRTIEAFKEAVWDPVETDKGNDVRLDDETVNVHNLDSTEYATEPYFIKLLGQE